MANISQRQLRSSLTCTSTAVSFFSETPDCSKAHRSSTCGTQSDQMTKMSLGCLAVGESICATAQAESGKRQTLGIHGYLCDELCHSRAQMAFPLLLIIGVYPGAFKELLKMGMPMRVHMGHCEACLG